MLATSFTASSGTCFLQGTRLQARREVAAPRACQPLSISARYRGKGTELSKVAQFKRHDADVGSPEMQVARLSARVVQLTAHLAEHRKDYSTTRGLMAILSQRKRLLEYLQRKDKPAYERVISTLGVRGLKSST